MPLILRTLKDHRTSLIVFCAAGILLLTLYIALFPTVQKQSEQFSKLLDSYPKAMMKVLNIEDMNFSTVEKFLAIEQYSFTWPLLVIFLAVSFAGSLVRDIEKGTIDFLLTRPISRLDLYFGRVYTSFIAVFVFVIASILFAIPIAAIVGVDFVAGNHIVMAMTGLLFGTSIIGIVSLFGVVFSERGKTYGTVGGLLVLMYILNIVAKLKGSVSGLRYFSLFHYFDASAALTKGDLSLSAILAFLIVASLTIIGGAMIFQNRDINASA